MLLNGGELDGVRILEASTVAQMMKSSLPTSVRLAGNDAWVMGPEHGTSWGLGFAIRTDPESSWVPGSVGSFAWSTYFWIDPAAQMVGVQMVQVPREDVGRYFGAIRHLAYAALDVSQAAPSEPDSPVLDLGSSTLSAYVGRYYFGASLSASDRQSVARSVFGGTGLNVTKEASHVTVDPVAGGPAEKAGVLKGDILTAIDGSATHGLSQAEIVAKLRGKADTATTLTLTRGRQCCAAHHHHSANDGHLAGCRAHHPSPGRQARRAGHGNLAGSRNRERQTRRAAADQAHGIRCRQPRAHAPCLPRR
jgi:PDZ domain